MDNKIISFPSSNYRRRRDQRVQRIKTLFDEARGTARDECDVESLLSRLEAAVETLEAAVATVRT